MDLSVAVVNGLYYPIDFQYFQLIAPRIERYTKLGGRPGNLLFNGMGNEIVRLVARPIQPQSIPSTSIIAAFMKPSAQPQSDCRAVEATARDSLQEVQENIDFPLHQVMVKTKSGNAKEEANIGSVTFFNLPMELHRQIFDHLECIDDIVCLGLTSRYFWAIARDYLHEHYVSYLGCWAGERIVFVGAAVEPMDYPPGLFSAEELDELPTTIAIPLNYENPDYTWPHDEPMTLFQFTIPLFADKQKFVSLSEEAMRLYVQCRDRNRFRYDPGIESTFRELVAEEATYFPQDERWILRNLTVKEFVRSEAIALKPEFIHGPFIDGFGFGEVIISRICWSTIPCRSMNCAVPIHKGGWAGHGFDITTLAKHTAETTEAEWRDVSDEVASEIAIICECKYGPDWREIICKRFFDGGDAS